MKNKRKKAAAKSEQAQRKAEERERNAKRLELSRELKMGDMNARRQCKAWREKMMSLALPTIKEDLQVAWRTFDRALDNQNYSISVLLDALDSADEEKRRNDALHTAHIDRLLEVYKQQLDESNMHYQTTVQDSLNSTRDQMDKFEQDENEKQSFLQTLIFSTKQQFEQFMENINTKNLSKLNARKEENENEQRIGKTMLKRRLHNISEELAGVLRDHEESTTDRRKDFEKIKDKDDKDQNIIARQSMRIENLYREMQKFRDKIVDFQIKTNKEIKDYKFERDYFHKAYLTMQNRLREEKILDKAQLNVLTVEYNKTIHFLNKYIEKLRKILMMIDLCKKFQTYKEEILLYPLSTMNFDTCIQETQEIPVDNEKKEITEQIQLLQKFLKIILVVENDIVKLKCEFEELNCQSNQLKNLLKLYMDTISESTPKKNQDTNEKPIIINLKDFIKLQT